MSRILILRNAQNAREKPSQMMKMCTNKYACGPSVNMRPLKGPQMELMWAWQGKIPKKIQLYGC